MYIGCQIFGVHKNNLLLKKKVKKSVRYNNRNIFSFFAVEQQWDELYIASQLILAS